MADDESINISIGSTFQSAGVTQAQKGIVDLNQSAQQIVAELRQVATAAGSTETEFLAMAGAASQAAMATGEAAQAEQILAIAMGEGAAATTEAAVAAETQTTALGGLEVAANSAKAAIGALGIGLGVLQAIKVGVGLAEDGAAADRTATAFNNLAKTAGTTGDVLLSSLRRASGGEISDLNLRLEASRAEFLGVAKSAQDFSTLMAIARNNAQQMGLTTQEAFDKLVDGLDKGTPRLLKQVGLNIDLKTAEASYAASIGGTVALLTDEQKKQALVQAVMEQGVAKIKATGGATEDLASGQERLGASFTNVKEKIGSFLATGVAPTVNAMSDLANGFDGTAQTAAGWINAVQNIERSMQGLPPVTAEAQAANQSFAAGLLEWLGVSSGAAAAVDQVAGATQQLTAAQPPLISVGAEVAAMQGNIGAQTAITTAAFQAQQSEVNALNAVTQTSVEAGMADAAAKQEVAAKTQLLTAETNQAVAAFMQLHPNIDAAGVAALATAGKIDPLLSQLIQATLRAREAAAALAAFNAAQGMKVSPAANFAERHGGVESGELTPGAQARAAKEIRLQQQINDAKHASDIKAAQDAQTLQNGTHAQKVAILQSEYDTQVKQHGAMSVEAINAQTKLQSAEQQGASKRASGAAAAGDKLTAIEAKTGDKIEAIVEATQKKITAIDEREAAKQAAALRKLNEDIATATADRRASNEADDLDLVGVKDAKEAAKLNDRERAEADARRREQQAQAEARAQANAGDAEGAQKTLAIREKQINDQQALDEKYYARQRELAGDPANEAALKKQYDEATRANEEAAQARIDITKQEADQKKADVQAEKDAVIAAANDQANQVVAAAEKSAAGVKKATAGASAQAQSDLRKIGDAVNAIPSQKTITITVNQQGQVGASSASGASSGNKSGGGGTFVTSGKTNLTVGDNPGGRELVTVTPLSGKGTTSVSGNIAQLAGGGAVLVDAGNGYTTPVAGTAPAKGGRGGGGGGKAPASVDPKKALDELKNTVQLLMDMAKLKEQIAGLANVPAFDIPMVQALIDRAQQFTSYVATHLVPITKAQGEALARYVTAATGAASVIKDLADLKKQIAELKNVPAFDQPVVLALIDRAQQFTAAMQQRLIPLTEFEATQMSRYRTAVGDTVGILKDVADLKKTLATDAAPIIDDRTIIALAEQAAHIETLVNQRLVPATKEQSDGIAQYASMVGSSTGILKDVLGVSGKLFTDYTSPSDAQIGMLAADAKRVADGVMAAASSYSTEGLAAGKAYAEGVGATFTAFKDGLLFFDALKSGDFKLDVGALASFEQSTLATLDVAKRVGAVAATIPAGDLAALQTTTAALAAQSEALIRLAAVPFGDIPGAAANLAQQAGALLGASGGGGTTITNYFTLPAGSNQQTAQEVIRLLNQQVGARR